MIKIDKIQLHNFRFFIDEEEHNSFELNGHNMLLYGENGSGKSSLYKAFEFLAQRDIEEKKFLESKNIFKDGDVSLFFKLNNGKDIVIDVENLINRDKYIDGLSMYKPMLEYKNLLKIHYEIDKSRDEINIYEMLRDAFKEYPIDNNQLLSDIKNPDNYFELLENILNSTILDKVNRYIVKFDKYFYIKKFFFDKEFTDDGKVEFIVNIKIDFMNKNIDYYHNFLNEAKLSALAMAIYFSIIRDISDNIEDDGLKLLILDDLLISLDMGNRLSLIELIKEYFSDFQIFFFTHDKGFFEILKDKMSWKAYELYVDNDGEFEKPYIKKSLNYFESAIKHFNEYDYPACANYLRKEVERIKKIVNQSDINGIPVDRSMQIVKKVVNSNDFIKFSNPNTTDEACVGSIRGKLIGIKNNLDNAREPSVEIDLKEINSVLSRILHPQSHDDTSKPLYRKELEEAIEIIKNIREGL